MSIEPLKVTVEGFDHGAPIPGRFAFAVPAEEGHVALSSNVSPAISWSAGPEGTQSYVLLVHDPDVPTVADDVNKEGRTVPSDLPRFDFFHWLLINIPATTTALAEGAGGEGVVARGKPLGETAHGVTGRNHYTAWFDGDAEMGGDYGGYDGPCPPWNDSIVHHYHFTVFALDVASIDLETGFWGDDVRKAIEGHVLAQGSHVGTYSLNPDVKG